MSSELLELYQKHLALEEKNEQNRKFKQWPAGNTIVNQRMIAIIDTDAAVRNRPDYEVLRADIQQLVHAVIQGSDPLSL